MTLRYHKPVRKTSTSGHEKRRWLCSKYFKHDAFDENPPFGIKSSSQDLEGASQALRRNSVGYEYSDKSI